MTETAEGRGTQRRIKTGGKLQHNNKSVRKEGEREQKTEENE